MSHIFFVSRVNQRMPSRSYELLRRGLYISSGLVSPSSFRGHINVGLGRTRNIRGLKDPADLIYPLRNPYLREGFPTRRLFSSGTNSSSRGPSGGTATSAKQTGADAASNASSANAAATSESSTQTAYYLAAVAVAIFGLAYAAVPLYKVFCQMTGFGGTTRRADAKQAILVKPVDGGRIIRVEFVGSVHSAMPWSFRPTQHAVKVVPGETALAFFTATNRANFPISGVATYNVQPPRAGLYFNKIQCFCFEEQRLGGNEEIDMPVFFYIDPAYAEDPFMANIENIVLSYTFFKTGEELPQDLSTAKIEPPRRGGFSSARSIAPASNSSSSGSTSNTPSSTTSSSSSSGGGSTSSASAVLSTTPNSVGIQR